MGAMPDMVPTLAAMALFADGKTVIRNVSHLRIKESDRLKSVTLEWSRLGGRVEELPDGLIIHGRYPLSGTVVDPHDDHRLAMSLAVVGLKVPGIRIRDEACVNKSFPMFWKLWDSL
jgi:3-phosphoshikimate 1-carboxyvinyltransferase